MTQEMIKSLPLADNIKMYLIGEDGGFKEKHRFYINLTQYYAPAFSFSSLSQLTLLSKASYLYFRSLLLVDSIIDNGKATQSMMILLPIYEEAIKNLAWLFSEHHEFWQKFNKRKKEYYTSVMHERTLTATHEITQSQFEHMAQGKSAVCYTILDAMVELSDSSIDINPLIQSLQHIHIGFQYLDDVDDFKEDLTTSQRTYAHSQVEKHLRELSIERADNTFKHKYLYLSGVANELISTACYHFKQALQIATSFELNDLVQFLNREIGIRSNQIQEIDLLIEKTKIKSGKSYVLAGKAKCEDESIHNAIRFLQNSITASNLFEDFTTTAGQSVAWATAFAGTQLSSVPEAENIISRLTAALIKTESYGYNNSVMDDGDSLNFIIWFLRSQQQPIPSELLNKWLRFMTNEGGWRTYTDGKEIKDKLKLGDEHADVSGWQIPVSCVTAVALNVLSLFPELSNEAQRTEEYLTGQINDQNHWDSYWWTSSVYATSFAIVALVSRKKGSELIKQSCKWLANQQNQDGSWSTEDGTPSAYYTALATQALIKAGDNRFLHPIAYAKNWLLGNQTTDGSWLPTRSLRIPATDVTHPATVKKWRKSSFGVNIVVDDHQRIFTTSTVIQALHLCRTGKIELVA